MRNRAELDTALQSDVGSTDVMLTSDMTLDAAYRLWLSRSFWKKFQDEKAQDADSKCLGLLLSANSRCKEFGLEPLSTQEEMVINEVKYLLDSLFFNGPDPVYSYDDFFIGCNCGPGASIDVSSYNFYTKLFDSTLSCTDKGLYRLYRDAIRTQPTWTCAEIARHNTYGLSIVAGNRLSFVPKTTEISRSICTEPVLNMFLQKGVGFVLEQALKRRFRISLDSQPELNRQLAHRGSIDGTYGTIDLSSASDSISLTLVKSLFPAYVLRWIMETRSPVTILPDGSQVELHMVSTMGNAFTFPLQTLIFSSLVVACYRVLGIKPKYGSNGPANFAVFGDDIIVRKDAYAFVTRCLSLFGFIVNDDKSFNTGNFRESCGGDYYKGHDIRGVYIKSLKTTADVYSTLNRLTRWSVKTGVLLPSVISLLKSWVKYRPIPFLAGDAEGVKCAVPPDYLKRDPNLHGAVKYRYLAKKTLSFRVPLEADRSFNYPKRSARRKAKYNSDGLLISLLGGFIRTDKRGGFINVRSDKDEFEVRCRTTSSWGSTAVAGFVTLEDDWKVISDLYGLTSQ